MEKKNKTYTANDFARYCSGSMEAKEMHALEKAAMEDPFIADALEGYAHTVSATEEVQNLNGALTKRTTGKKVFSLASVSQNTWWRIAAIFILVGIAGYFIFNEDRQDGRTLARQEIATLENEVAKTIYHDSMVNSKELALQNESGALESSRAGEKMQAAPSIIQPPVTKSKAKPTIPSDLLRSKSTEVSDEPVLARVSPQPEEEQIQSTLPDNYDSGNITAFSRRADNSKRILLKEKVSESEKKNLKGKPAYAYAPEGKNDSPKMLFKQGQDSNNTQIIAKGLPSAKAKKIAGVTINNKTFYFEIPAESALKPKKGSDDYQNYLAKNRKQVVNQIDQPVHGKVHLQFNIDQDGKPINISLLESDCINCEKQAKELLENGPLWKGGLTEKGTLILIF